MPSNLSGNEESRVCDDICSVFLWHPLEISTYGVLDYCFEKTAVYQRCNDKGPSFYSYRQMVYFV
jgi:hypothetical protein